MRYINFEVMIIAFVALSFLWTLFKIIRVRMLGVEVNAFITRLEEHETTDAMVFQVSTMRSMSGIRQRTEERSIHLWLIPLHF